MFLTDSKFQGEFIDGALTLTYALMDPVGIVPGRYGSGRCGLRPGLTSLSSLDYFTVLGFKVLNTWFVQCSL